MAPDTDLSTDPQLLDHVESTGETIEVTNHGRPVARIVPVRLDGKSTIEELIAAGYAKPAEGDLLAFLRDHPPLPLRPGAPTLSELLAQDREE